MRYVYLDLGDLKQSKSDEKEKRKSPTIIHKEC